MKKSALFLGLLAILCSCNSKKINTSDNNTTSNTIDVTDNKETSKIDTYFAKFSGNMIYDAVYTNLTTNYSYGVRSLFYADNDVKAYGGANISFINEEKKLSSYQYYFADLNDNDNKTYQEVLHCDNVVHKEYVKSDGEYVNFDSYYFNPFSVLTDSDFTLLDNQLTFINSDLEEDFISQLITVEDKYESYFQLENNKISSFVIESDTFNLTYSFVSFGDEVSINHVSPITEDTSDKSELEKAINKIGKNYTVYHYRSSEKYIVYYADDKIVLDQSADSLGNLDTYYYYQDNNSTMNRKAYGKEDGVGPYIWSDTNYAEMEYDNSLTYDDLLVRLKDINLNLFKKNGDSKYTTVDTAASLLFPYCQPAMNARALINDGAKSINIILNDGEIERIQLVYDYDPYGNGGVSKTDTIFFKDLGSTSIPEIYQKSLNSDTLEIPSTLLGEYIGTSEDGLNKSVSLKIEENRKVTYVVNGVSYQISDFYYYELEEYIEIAFNYDSHKRFVTLRYDPETLSFSGYDSEYSDLTNFFNITITKKV